MTTEDMQKIAQELMLGKLATILGPQAEDFRRRLKQDLAKAKANGWTVELPFEIEVSDHSE